MGADQSKPSQEEEKVVYSDQSNVSFSSDLLNHLSDSLSSPTPTPARQETLDSHIRQRIQTELQRLQAEEQEVRAEIERVLEKENLDKEVAGAEEGKEVHSEILSRDMEELKKKVEKFEGARAMRGEGREEVKAKQEAVVSCYKSNPSRPLDCWREVGDFKESVAKLEQHYIQSFR